MKHAFSLVAIFAAMPTLAEDARELDAHEHGVGVLNIAMEGTKVAMEFHAPGADIVGFEYAAESNADLAAVAAAIEALEVPLDLFVMPDAAECSVSVAHADLEGGEDRHDEHHEDHADEDHVEKNEEGHDDHDEDDHGEDDHEEHADESGHTEFHAEYELECTNPEALTLIDFAYFDSFPNAKEVEVQIITSTGAQAYEVERDAPKLDLGK